MRILLIVLAIAVAFISYSMYEWRRRSSVEAAQRDLTSLMLALQGFSAANGRYPTAGEGFEVLYNSPNNGIGSVIRGSLKTCDPWDHAYIYHRTAFARKVQIQVISMGPDGMAGTFDDIIVIVGIEE
jgi:general secretion pathway protein G